MQTNINNYVSIKEIVDGLMMYPAMRDLQYESAIKWTVDIMGLVGSYELYKDERDTIIIENHRGKVPRGLIRAEMCRRISGTGENREYQQMNYATDEFQTAYDKYPDKYKEATQRFTYKLQGDYIFTSFERGFVELAYKTLYTDDDGVIMLPTNSSLSKAIEAYIKQEHFRGLYEIEKISKAIFEEAKVEYCWYIGQAQNSVMNVSRDERQMISNAVHKLMWNEDEASTGFRNLGDKEYIRDQH